jgi:hypothetical protein
VCAGSGIRGAVGSRRVLHSRDHCENPSSTLVAPPPTVPRLRFAKSCWWLLNVLEVLVQGGVFDNLAHK